MRQIVSQPRVVTNHCTACKECVKICPTGAATMINKVAGIDKTKCIQCMCCHEVCRDNAIVLRRSFTGNIMTGLVNIARKILKR